MEPKNTLRKRRFIGLLTATSLAFTGVVSAPIPFTSPTTAEAAEVWEGISYTNGNVKDGDKDKPVAVVKAGETTKLPPRIEKPLPEGHYVTWNIAEGVDKQGWTSTTKDNVVSVTVPAGIRAGTRRSVEFSVRNAAHQIVGTIPVTLYVAKPDNALSDHYEPQELTKEVIVGQELSFSVADGLPKGTKFAPVTGNLQGWISEMTEDGTATIKAPDGSIVGTSKTLLYQVLYTDGTYEYGKINVKVAAPENPQSDAKPPSYSDYVVLPGTSVRIQPNEPAKNVKEFIAPTVPEGWTVTPEKSNDGAFTLTVPKEQKPNFEYTLKTQVVYTDGSTNYATVVVNVKQPETGTIAAKYDPSYGNIVNVLVGKTTTIKLKTAIPEQTTFEISQSDKKNPFNYSIDKNSGAITVSPDASLPAGSWTQRSVTVRYEDNSVDYIPIKIVAQKDLSKPIAPVDSSEPTPDPKPAKRMADSYAPAYPAEIPVYIGENNTVSLRGDTKLPEGTTFAMGSPKTPEKWNYSVNSTTGLVTVSPASSLNQESWATSSVIVTYPDKSTDIINVKFVAKRKPTTPPKSSEPKPSEEPTTPPKSSEPKPSEEPTSTQKTTEPKPSEEPTTPPKSSEPKPSEEPTSTQKTTEPKPAQKDAEVYSPSLPADISVPSGKIGTVTVGEGANLPAGTQFFVSTPKDPEKLSYTIDSTSGKLTVTPGKNLKSNVSETATVTVQYPDQSTDKLTVKLVAQAKSPSNPDTDTDDTNSSSSSAENRELNPGAIAGIIIGILALLGLGAGGYNWAHSQGLI
ncbi:MAG: YPDG domain-containing protein [Corynebacterium glucuronolyticum]|nr:YPDG domain-containing protein [Corynebacterium glucuronolyticum]